MKRNQNRIVVANSKGGVTKTTSLCELAAHASFEGKRVLCIDLDPQANTTSTLLGHTPTSKDKTLFDLLIDNETDIKDVLCKGSDNWPHIWLLPANQKLEKTYKFLESEPNWISRLDEVIQQIEHNFDAILIDTPPTMGLLTKLAIMAANKLLIPTDTSRFSNDGDETILALAEHIQEKTGHKLETIKMVLTLQQKGGARANVNARKYLKEHYKKIFWDIELPHCVKAIEAQRMYSPPKSVSSLLTPDHKLYKGYQQIAKALIV